MIWCSRDRRLIGGCGRRGRHPRCDRVVVLTGSPGSVHEVVDIDLGRPRSRTDEAVAEYEARLREATE